MSIGTLTQDILDARRNLPRFITNTNAARDLADHLTTRGWRQQTTITTPEEIKALPERAVIRTAKDEILELTNIDARGNPWWYGTNGDWTTGADDYTPETISLPARVLYIPEEQ